MSPNPDPLFRARRRAILLVVGASAAFALAAAAVKALGGEIPLAQVIFCRNLFALPILLAMVPRAGGFALLRPRAPWRHVERTFWGMFGMAGAFYGYAHLPIATVTALGFTMPLLLTMLSIPLLGERVGWRRWTAVGGGLLGVLVMVRPGFGVASLDPGAVGMVLLGTLGWAMAMISIRKMGEAGEAGVAIVIWFAIGAASISALLALPFWVWPTPTQWLLLMATGVVSSVAQLLMTEAYRRGETTLIAPFEYAGILWTGLLGAVFWAELPDWGDFVGISILVAAGIYIWRREVVRGVSR